MKRVAILLLLFLPATVQSQEIPLTLTRPAAVETVGRSDFHAAVIEASRKLVQSGELSRRDSLKLRVAMLSPAFRKHAEDLAVVQMFYSGDDGVPMTETGHVDRAAIDWESLISFIERLIPLIMQLLDLFGGAP